MIGVKNRKLKRLGRWAHGGGQVRVEKRKGGEGGLLTHKVYIFTHTCTHT